MANFRTLSQRAFLVGWEDESSGRVWILTQWMGRGDMAGSEGKKTYKKEAGGPKLPRMSILVT